MILLVLSVALSFVSLHHSALVENRADLQLNPYHHKIIILSELLTKECPEYIQQTGDVTKQQTLTGQASLVKHLEQLLLECRESKLVSTTTTSSRNTIVSTDPTPLCPSYDGDSVFNMQFISYNNPTNKRATGVGCATDGSPCSIFFDICVSPINSTNCEFFHHMTDIVGERSTINLINNLGDLKNPVRIPLGHRKWQGAHVQITVLERNPANSLRVYHEVDEFSYDLTDVQGSVHRLLTLYGKHATDKTELVMMFTVPCPSTTLPTTSPTIRPTTTTSTPVPAECLTATNLTQSWRLDHSGSDLRGGGFYSYDGYACDLYNMGWFRFTGAAGTHMLDTCPKVSSCGAKFPIWTDGTPPQAVGVTGYISVHQLYYNDCKHFTRTIQVMRCSLSTDHDLIYRYPGTYITGTNTCWQTFCGIN